MSTFEPHNIDRDDRAGRGGDLPFDDVPLERLADDISAPDFTNRVMNRLGFNRCEAIEAARLRHRQFMARGATACMFAAVVGLGVYMHGLSDRARRPVENAMPSAMQVDLNRMSEGMRSLGAELRPLLQRPAPTPEEREQDEAARRRIDEQSQVWWGGVL